MRHAVSTDQWNFMNLHELGRAVTRLLGASGQMYR